MYSKFLQTKKFKQILIEIEKKVSVYFSRHLKNNKSLSSQRSPICSFVKKRRTNIWKKNFIRFGRTNKVLFFVDIFREKNVRKSPKWCEVFWSNLVHYKEKTIKQCWGLLNRSSWTKFKNHSEKKLLIESLEIL